MSIASEITRLLTARSAIRSAIIDKGVAVPSDAVLEDMPTYIAQIQSGSSCDMYAGNEAPSGSSAGDLWVDTVDENTGTIVYNPAMGKVSSTTYTNVCQVTVPATGTYKATWQHYSYANSQQYYMTQLYVGNSATGSVHYPTTYSTAPTAAVENNLSLTANQTVSVRARSRSGGSYFTMAGCLILEKVG